MQQKNCVLLPPKSYASLSSLLSSLFSLLERKRELEHERRTTAAVLPQAPPPLRASSAARGLFLRGAGAGGAGGREKARSSNSFADGRQRRRSADFAPRFPASSGSSFSARSSPLPPADARRGLFTPGRGAGRAPGARHGAERRGRLREGGDGGGGDDDLLFVSFFSGSSAPALPLLFPRPLGPLRILALFACLISKGDGGRKRNNKG